MRARNTEREQRRRRIAKLREDGLTNRQIAGRLGWGADDARVGAEISRMRAAGWQIDRREHTTPDEMRQRKATAALMWEDDFPAAEIAETLEIGERACISMLQRMRQAGEIEARHEPKAARAPKRELVASLAADGLPYQEIAERTGQSTSAVAGVISTSRRIERGTQNAPHIPRRVGDGRAQLRREEVRRLAEQNRPVAEIAKLTGYTPGSVRTIISANAVTMQRDKPSTSPA